MPRSAPITPWRPPVPARTFPGCHATEANVFRLIARNVLAQFYPPLETREVKAEFTILEERFRAQGREILAPGWKPLFTTRDEAPPLPPLQEGESSRVQETGVEDRETRPPEPFNDASLIKAMMNIARYVEDPAVKRTLRTPMAWAPRRRAPASSRPYSIAAIWCESSRPCAPPRSAMR